MKLKRIIVSTIALVTTGIVHATPVTWELDNVKFSDGATATGSFTYDASSNTYSAINITTSSILDSMGYWNGFTYNSDENYGPESSTQITGTDTGLMFEVNAYPDFDGVNTLTLDFNNPLPSNGGVDNVSFIDENNVDDRSGASGEVVAEVPEPASVMLFGAALIAMLLTRRKFTL